MVCYLICYKGDEREDRGHSNSHRAQESSLTGALVKCWHSKQVTRTIRKRKKEITIRLQSSRTLEVVKTPGQKFLVV